MNNKLKLRSMASSSIRSNKKVRTCLMCGKDFRSAGSYNRRCPRCDCRLEYAREGSYYELIVYSFAYEKTIDSPYII